MIIITGMHRSGTSFFAKLLFELGGDFGPQSLLLCADKFNEKGYFENKEIFSLNERLIHGPFDYSARYWSSPGQKRRLLMRLLRMASGSRYFFPPNRNNISLRADKIRPEIAKLSDKYDSTIVKDPRFSLTIGAWKKYGKIDKVLYCYRHPFEVARSLKRRDYLPIGIGYRLWYFHVKEFFDQAKDLKVIVVNYNNFFEKKEKYNELRRIFNFIERDYTAKEAERLLQSVLDVKIKHYTHREEKLPTVCEKMYRSLEKYHHSFSTLQLLKPNIG